MTVKVDTSEVRVFLANVKRAPVAGARAVAQVYKEEAQIYPAQKSVTRKAAYGVTFFSDVQRAFFFAALADGSIKVPYPRTDAFKNSWTVEDQGTTQIVSSSYPKAGLLVGSQRSRMSKLIGWRTLEQIVNDAAGKAQAAVDRAIAKAL